MRLAAIFKQVRPAAIQSWMYHADLLSLAALKLSGALHNTRLYWGVRCSDMQGKHYGHGFRAVRKLCAMLSGRPTGIVANSFAGREVHVRRGYAAPNFMVIPNGIDVDRFSPNPIRREALRQQLGLAASDVVAFTAARVDPMKGYELVKLAATALPDLRFVIAGTGTEELSLPANVTALGHRTDLPDLLPVADILLSPSLFGEGFSNSIAEGMAVALCPVVSDVGDARLIAGGCGEVFKPGDVHSLASILRRLVDGGSDALSERGRMARERITAQFSMAEMVRSFDALHLHGEQPLRSA
jgi:glycosyltransferase involved in cell wall biosynthesis